MRSIETNLCHSFACTWWLKTQWWHVTASALTRNIIHIEIVIGVLCGIVILTGLSCCVHGCVTSFLFQAAMQCRCEMGLTFPETPIYFKFSREFCHWLRFISSAWNMKKIGPHGLSVQQRLCSILFLPILEPIPSGHSATLWWTESPYLPCWTKQGKLSPQWNRGISPSGWDRSDPLRPVHTERKRI